MPDGEVGELVVTSLTKECSPVLRYRTGDLSRVTHERCACGRTTARMGKIIGRTDDMFIVSGVNVFPSTVESVLFRIEGLEPHYEIVLERLDSSTPSRCESRSAKSSSTAGWTISWPSNGR